MQHMVLTSAKTLVKIADDSELLDTWCEIAETVSNALKKGKKLIIAGNGGSAADAQHLAAEFVVKFSSMRPAMRAIALTTDSSILTAAGNDLGFSKVFSRQIEAIGNAGDVFLAISTLGNSDNIIQALRTASEMQLITIGLTGSSGGMMKPLCDKCICVPSTTTSHIQEAHLVLEHALCAIVERLHSSDRPDTCKH